MGQLDTNLDLPPEVRADIARIGDVSSRRFRKDVQTAIRRHMDAGWNPEPGDIVLEYAQRVHVHRPDEPCTLDTDGNPVTP